MNAFRKAKRTVHSNRRKKNICESINNGFGLVRIHSIQRKTRKVREEQPIVENNFARSITNNKYEISNAATRRHKITNLQSRANIKLNSTPA